MIHAFSHFMMDEAPTTLPILNRPLMVYDGDCPFCRYWVGHWRWITRGRVDFAPAREAGERFPWIPPEQFARSVVLIQPDGRIASGAHAVFQALARRPGWGVMLWLYMHLPIFAWVSEAAYRFVAAHRGGLMRLTRWFWRPRPVRQRRP
jgi:lipase maturation factor 1